MALAKQKKFSLLQKHIIVLLTIIVTFTIHPLENNELSNGANQAQSQTFKMPFSHYSQYDLCAVFFGAVNVMSRCKTTNRFD